MKAYNILWSFLLHGFQTDHLHFLFMIVKVIMKSLKPNYVQELFETSKLFYSQFFLQQHDFYVLQYIHPIFFNLNECLSFIDITLDYIDKNMTFIYLLGHFMSSKFSFCQR